jgi:hypothetical protein
VKLREADRVVSNPLRQELQCDGLAQPQVICAVDFSHPTAPQKSNDAIALIEDNARRKAPVITI